jgi:hypothetical protein
MTRETLYARSRHRLLARALEDPDLEREWTRAQAEYFTEGPPAGASPEARAASGRCEEWFLFERPSARYGEVPYLTCLSRAQSGADPEVRDFLEEMAGNLLGAFEVLEAQPGHPLALVDLFSGREVSVLEEPEVVGEIEAGDLVVGRVFPVGSEEFVLSEAAALFRSKSLLEAVREDLARARASAPTARLSQRELESIFWGGPRGEAPAAGDDGRALAEEEAREIFREASLADLSFEDVRDALAQARLGGPVIAPILDRLAFETEVDLERARRALWSLWSALRVEPEVDAAPAGATTSAAEAVARFEAGRARGENLDALFAQLEKDLDLEEGESPIEGEESFEAPSTLGPVFEEYFWEAKTRGEGESIARLPVLEAFRAFLVDEVEPPVRDPEGIEESQVARFVARRFFPRAHGPLPPPEEAEAFRLALAEFCGWAQAEQDVPLLDRMGAVLEKLRVDLPRALEANASLEGKGSAGSLPASVYRVLVAPSRGERAVVVEESSGKGAPISLRVEEALAPSIREGDLLEGDLGAAGELRVTRLVPPFIAGIGSVGGESRRPA